MVNCNENDRIWTLRQKNGSSFSMTPNKMSTYQTSDMPYSAIRALPAYSYGLFRKKDEAFNPSKINPLIQTEDDALAVILQEGGFALRNISRDLRTQRVCLAAVQENGYALEFVKKQTLEICMAALRQNRDAEQFISIGMQTNELWNMMMEEL
jgi:hypothetical protein